MFVNMSAHQYAIGAHPDSARVLVLASGLGRCFDPAQMIGEFITDLAYGQERPDFAGLSPSRFAGER